MVEQEDLLGSCYPVELAIYLLYGGTAELQDLLSVCVTWPVFLIPDFELLVNEVREVLKKLG